MKDDTGDFIQKMLELGIGLSMVKQMPAMMSGVMPTQTPPAMAAYYVAVNGKQAGPFSEDEMHKMVNGSLINTETLIWKQGMQTWNKASDVPEINKYLLMKNL